MNQPQLPVARPGKVIAVGLNYRDHAAESATPLPESPVLFAKWPSCLVPDGAPVVLPPGIDNADYEAELAVVIGREARGVSADDALDFVAGYLALNDVTDRKAQAKDGQWSRAKSYDTFGPCGPRLVPAAEIPDPQKLAITMDLNGQRMQDSTTANMIFDVRTLIEFISRTITLEVGDIITTGTPDGVGAFRPIPVFLKPGDEMVVTVEGIGPLTNRVVAGEHR
jgi:2-keto-4-pentenoate hydratase/2-oxohepta-3-ene-1,7-dioic acid hydratase in catechol pathway